MYDVYVCINKHLFRDIFGSILLVIRTSKFQHHADSIILIYLEDFQIIPEAKTRNLVLS